MCRRSIGLVFLVSAAVMFVSGCGGGLSSNTRGSGGPPPPPPPSGGSAAVIQLISVNVNGLPSNGNSYTPPAISQGGRYVAFQSDATDLVAGAASGFTDIYLRDTCEGATSCTPSTIRISVADDGTLPDGNSRSPAISATGRYVAYDSSASNLVPGDTNGSVGPFTGLADVFVRDTCIGASACTPRTFRASLAFDGSQATGDPSSSSVTGDSRFPSISADGRFVAFSSSATNLVSGDTNGNGDVFVRDTCAGVSSGCSSTTFRVSISSSGAQGNSDSGGPAISADGRFVAFLSYASNLVTGDTNTQGDIFVHDTCFGASGCTPSTIRASLGNDGSQANDHLDTISPAINGNGRFVAFTSFANNLVANDTNGLADVFLRDTCAVATSCAPSTMRASVASNGNQANQGSTDPSISQDGRFIAFDSLANNLVSPTTTAPKDVFVRDTCLGASSCTPTTILVSRSQSGSEGNGESFDPAVSANGTYIVFLSTSTNLISTGANGLQQVWLAKLQ
jgi:Tol biopolymer transport system component